MPTPIEKLVVIEKVKEKVANRYEAVRVIAKEARRLNALVIRGAETDEDFKPTSTALERLFSGKVQYEFVEKKEEPDELFSD